MLTDEHSFNRTTVECKWAKYNAICKNIVGFNRTTVECKYRT